MKTKPTPRPGENKTNRELQQLMIELSNNSRLTLDACKILSNKLDERDTKDIISWFRHANTQQRIKRNRQNLW